MNTYPLPECESDRGFDLEGSEAHATRGCDGCQEGCESGYYDLHRDLNDAFLHHWCLDHFPDVMKMIK